MEVQEVIQMFGHMALGVAIYLYFSLIYAVNKKR